MVNGSQETGTVHLSSKYVCMYMYRYIPHTKTSTKGYVFWGKLITSVPS